MIRIDDHGLVYYQFAMLRAERGLRHGFFTRLGGMSQPPYATLNVGASVGDDADAVAENRRRCLAALGFDEAQVVTPCQVHSARVAKVGAAEGGQIIADTDGLLSAETGLALLLRFADCVPIMLYDREQRAIGLVHAGWRGTLEGIATRAVQAIQAHFGCMPDRLWAGIGPAIGRCCYEVGSELGDRFRARFGPQVLSEPRTGGARLDLAAANVLALQEVGVRNIEQAELCTACHSDEFFSHRREGGHTGRLAALIGLTADAASLAHGPWRRLQSSSA